MRYDRRCAVDYACKHALCTYGYQSGKDADATSFVLRCIAAGLSIDSDFACADPALLFDALQEKISVRACALSDVREGDVVQIRTRADSPYKSLIVTRKKEEAVFVAGHSYISIDRPLESYRIYDMRCIHIGN